MATDERGPIARPWITYTVRADNGSFSISRAGKRRIELANLGDLLYAIEKDLTVSLQRIRADLYFLHAAVVEWRGRAIVLAAASGRGKSTTAWALLHHGFGYLSDELGPVDVGALLVHPYPHALCLKQPPPAPYGLPAAALHLGRRIHVPVPHLPAKCVKQPLPLGAVLLVCHVPALTAPTLRRLSMAEASVRIYTTALNALAHPDRGLAPAMRIARSVPCFEVATAGLAATGELLRTALDQAVPC
jgi:hypothetical protein